MGGLLQYFEKQGYSPLAIQAVSFTLQNLSLPVPDEGEFFTTNDRGALVFLTPIACALRITSEQYTGFDHPRILRPLFSRASHGLRIDLFPGLHTPFHGRDYTEWFGIYAQMESEIAAAGIKVTDINGNNGGVLPAPHQDYYIFIDPGAMKRLGQGVREIEQALAHGTDPQAEIFGGLAESFTAAWPLGSTAPDPDLLGNAYRLCREMKANGQLIANWQNIDYAGTKLAAARYTAQLQTNHLFAA